MIEIKDLNFKALVIGAVVSTAFILLGYYTRDWFYPLSAAGLLYAGYGQNDLKAGALCGAVASLPLVILTLKGYMGAFDGFFLTQNGMIILSVLIIAVGAFVGLVGVWVKISRMKEYEKKQSIGKKKKRNKK